MMNMLRKIVTDDNFLKMYKTFIPVCSYIGFLYGANNTLYTRLDDKFVITIITTTCGTLFGIGWPLIIPTTIVFTPFAIYDTYKKSIKV
jgi:hypothetical protein